MTLIPFRSHEQLVYTKISEVNYYQFSNWCD